ncbi:MAG: DUF4838 domain-containing protein [Oscillospiraceae bacterium]|jgi:hypothetical protein|nr:DUF4838 domain-containing protein [Oscillospiraceae bacterium]
MINQKGLVIFPNEFDDDWAGRFLDTDLNLLGLHTFEGSLGLTLEQTAAWLQNPETRRRLDRMSRAGVAVEFESHALSWLLPRDVFARQPAWFRVNERGERVNDHHFCHSNTEALEYISEQAKLAAELFVPTTHRYHLWLDDTEVACHCPKCEELTNGGYTPSDVALLVDNAILRGLRAVDSGAKQCYLAYASMYDAPRNVQPAEGIFLEYAPMAREIGRPLNDPECEKNAKTAGYIDGLLQTFSTKDAKVLDYWLDNSWFSNWRKPIKKFHFRAEAARADVAFYAAKGFEIITSFACFLGKEYYETHGEHADIGVYAAIFKEMCGTISNKEG